MPKGGSLLSLLLLCSSLVSSESFSFGDACSYTDEFVSTSVKVDSKSERLIGFLPPNKAHFALMLTSNENVNIKVVYPDGSMSMSESSEIVSLNHNGMSVMSCGVNCEETKPYSLENGLEFALSNQWLTVDGSSEPIAIFAVNDDSTMASTNLKFLWQCASSCNTCRVFSEHAENRMLSNDDSSGTATTDDDDSSADDSSTVDDSTSTVDDSTSTDDGAGTGSTDDDSAGSGSTDDEDDCADINPDCASAKMFCSSYFCPTCSYPNWCDKTCGFCATDKPTLSPTRKPTELPTSFPTHMPSRPTTGPTHLPSTSFPSHMPSAPSASPTHLPSRPTQTPTHMPSAPTQEPTHSVEPTSHPIPTPTPAPSAQPIPAPTNAPVFAPTSAPIPSPTSVPIPSPTSAPVPAPTSVPIPAPTYVPVPAPTSVPVPAPTSIPIPSPTTVPVPVPTSVPIPSPTSLPIPSPSSVPIPSPSAVPVPAPTPLPSSPYPTRDPQSPPIPAPTRSPSSVPVPAPTQAPVFAPTKVPVPSPSSVPVPSPSSVPIPSPSSIPVPAPSAVPVPVPTSIPVPSPSSVPVPAPSAVPVPAPTSLPVPVPTSVPVPAPTRVPVPVPTSVPVPVPTSVPVPSPSSVPVPVPSAVPIPSPTSVPIPTPTKLPFPAPSAIPHPLPTVVPLPAPTFPPIPKPTVAPIPAPTQHPIFKPTSVPLPAPTSVPVPSPSALPIPSPTSVPISAPTSKPTHNPTSSPVPEPSSVPVPAPSSLPTVPAPTRSPASIPIPAPTHLPTIERIPSSRPTHAPIPAPSGYPSIMPSPVPTHNPVPLPTGYPSLDPSPVPTHVPVPAPTPYPTPTRNPTSVPLPAPSSVPVPAPSAMPTFEPTHAPTSTPTQLPTYQPTHSPTPQPTHVPFPIPTPAPTHLPTSEPTGRPTEPPTPVPTHLPTPDPTHLPTPAPTAGPFALIQTELTLGLTSIASASDFDEVAETVFKKTIVAISASLTKTNQITSVNATNRAAGSAVRRLSPAMADFEDKHLSSRRLGLAASERENRHLLQSSGIDVTFTIEVDVREVSAASGKSYDISGPASDDAWASSEESYAVAAEFLSDFAAEIDTATAVSADGTSSWDTAADAAVASLPAIVTNGGTMKLAADTSGVAYDPSTIYVEVCRWDKPCYSPTPGPTIPHPSQVPTPVPTIDRPYDLAGPGRASATFIAVGFIQLLFCAGLAYKYTSNTAKKRIARTDWAAQKELSKFNDAHFIDLFGAKGFGLSKDKGQKQGSRETGPMKFTEEMVDHMFNALDLDQDSKISKRDVELWLRSQKIGKADGFTGVLQQDELDAFLGAGVTFLRPPSQDRNGRSASRARSAPRGTSQSRLASRLVQNQTSGDLNAPQLGTSEKFLSREDLHTCLDKFPMLAFDWEDPLGVAAEKSAFAAGAQGRSISREACAEIFRRIDSDGDGWVRASDVRVWRRMLPLGRSEEQLTIALLSRATKTSSVKRASMSEFVNEDEVGIKMLEFSLTLREDPVLAAELSAQCALLEYLMAGEHEEAPAHEDGIIDLFSSFDDPDLQNNIQMLESHKPTASTNKDVLSSIASIRPHDNDIASDNTLSVFICVAKLKLCRLTVARHEIDNREDNVVGEVFRTLAGSKGYVTCSNFQKYMHKRAGLTNLTREDFALILGDMVLVGEEKQADDHFEMDLDGKALKNGRKHVHEKHFNHKSLREVFSRSVHHNLANRLYTYMTVTQRMATNAKVTAMKEAGGKLIDSHGNPVKTVAPFHGVRLPKPKALNFEEMHILFSQIESCADLSQAEKGYVAPKHVLQWVTAANGRHLISSQDIESLFHPDLPSFRQSKKAKEVEEADEARVSRASRTSRTSRISKALGLFSHEEEEEEHHIAETATEFELDEIHAKTVEMCVENSPVEGGLSERVFMAALKRRPFLSVRLGLLMKQYQAMEASLHAECTAGAASAAATLLATAKAHHEKYPEDERYLRNFEVAERNATEAVAAAAEAAAAFHALAGGVTPELKELEAMIADAESDDAYGHVTIKLRKQLKEAKSRGNRHDMAVLYVEVGLTMKLIQLREAEMFPIQTGVLKTLCPLQAGSLPVEVVHVRKTPFAMRFNASMQSSSFEETTPEKKPVKASKRDVPAALDLAKFNFDPASDQGLVQLASPTRSPPRSPMTEAKKLLEEDEDDIEPIEATIVESKKVVEKAEISDSSDSDSSSESSDSSSESSDSDSDDSDSTSVDENDGETLLPAAPTKSASIRPKLTPLITDVEVKKSPVKSPKPMPKARGVTFESKEGRARSRSPRSKAPKAVSFTESKPSLASQVVLGAEDNMSAMETVRSPTTQDMKSVKKSVKKSSKKSKKSEDSESVGPRGVLL